MSRAIGLFYRFGYFTVDTDQKILLRQGKPLPLTPKVFDTLLVLIENSRRIVEKEKLMSRLLPDTFVEEANLTFIGATADERSQRLLHRDTDGGFKINGDDPNANVNVDFGSNFRIRM